MQPATAPILILIFNRPQKVRELICALEKVKPTKIFVFADGPRVGVPADLEKCAGARALFNNLSWPCEIHTNFSEVNLGCMNGPVSGINWFFDQVDEGIILEDDCIPHPSFFSLTSTLLTTYRNDNRIMHISGTSFLGKASASLADKYYFSKIAHGWGWATWRRAWEKFDLNMEHIPELEKQMEKQFTFKLPRHRKFWLRLFKHIARSKTDLGIWDAQWEYSILYNQGLCITPTINLVENVGFDNDATHTKEKPDFLNPAESLILTEKEGVDVVVNRDFDAQVMEQVFKVSLLSKISSTIKEWYYGLSQK